MDPVSNKQECIIMNKYLFGNFVNKKKKFELINIQFNFYIKKNLFE